MLNWYKKAQAPEVYDLIRPAAWSMDHSTVYMRSDPTKKFKRYVFKNVSLSEHDHLRSLALVNNWDSAWAIISKWKDKQVEPEPKQQDNSKASPTHQQEFDW